MKVKMSKGVMLLPAIGVVFAGLMLIVSPVLAIFIYQSIATTIGIMLMLLFILVGVWEITISRSIVGMQVGEWSGIMKTVALAMVLQVIAVLTTKDIYFILNLVAIALDGVALIILYVSREAFMPTAEEAETTRKRFARVSLKTVAKCPKCGGVVEPEWSLCPECGTVLPKYCPKCGNGIKEGEASCCKCGLVIEVSLSLKQMVETLRKTAELEAEPEMRSARYARLGDGLLKVGQLDEAVEAFRTAIGYTNYDRKRTNFMVKMAVVMANKGDVNEAERLLTEAIAIDPQDVAGANAVKEDIRKCAA